MKKLCVVATSNPDKLREIQEILSAFPFDVHAASELGEVLEVVEDSDTFRGNASLKAEAYHRLYPDAYILADDSGLAVDALDGMPGIYSARFGNTSDYTKKSELIWSRLRERGVPEEEWTARFHCAVAWWQPQEDKALIFEEEFVGRIVPYQKGDHGFGYDPIFFLPDLGVTSAELDPEVKNKISHRAKALAKLQDYLSESVDMEVK